jgi:hypothetical protein
MRPMAADILILSEEDACCYEPAGDEVCISITDPDADHPRLSPRFRAILRLSFSDIETPGPLPSHVLFDEQHAHEILEFFDTWRTVDRIVIHCFAGLSRSPGVAIGLCELSGGSFEPLEEAHPLWNAWVRSELVRVGKVCGPSAGRDGATTGRRSS